MTKPSAGRSATDITQVILDHHETFRRGFARLDELAEANEPGALTGAWQPLADLLDVHAVAEEEIFYPQLLRRVDDAVDETLDAIDDHNDIRDAIREAAGEEVGSDPWWSAVGRVRLANDEHMAEEEREGLAYFRGQVAVGLRESLGRRFVEFVADHPDPRRLDTADKDPRRYVERYEGARASADGEQGQEHGRDHTPDRGHDETGAGTGVDDTDQPARAEIGLGIGSLKGR